MKTNHQPCYIDVGSIQPKHVPKQIPNGITFRLSTNSSSANIFNQNNQDYERALENSGRKTKLTYINTDNSPNMYDKWKNRARKILRSNLPYKLAVTTKIGKIFFKLLKMNSTHHLTYCTKSSTEILSN